MQQKLHDTKQRWNDVKDKTNNRQEVLEKVVPLSKKLRDELQSFKPWLNDAEKRLQAIEPDSCDRGVILKQLKALKELRDDVDSHKPEHETVKEDGSSLIDNCQSDKYVAEGEVQDASKRYNALLENISSLEKQLLNTAEAAEQFEESLQPVDELHNKVEKFLALQEPVGIDQVLGKDAISNVEKLLEDLKDNEPKLDEAKDAGQNLLSMLDEKSPDHARVKQELQAVDQKNKDLVDALNDYKAKLEKDLQQAEKFHDAVKTLEDWIPTAQERVAAQEPVSSDPQTVKDQLQQTEVVKSTRCTGITDGDVTIFIS